jgi:hypothetical protein
MMSALTLEMLTRPPGVSAGPTTMTSLEITGGELLPMPSGRVERHVEVELLEQIDRPALPEALDRPARLRIERHQLEPWRDENDALVLTAGPVRDTTMHFARRRVEARTLVGPPGPYRFTGTRIGGNDSTPLPRGEVQLPAHHDRRRFVRRRLGLPIQSCQS